MPNWTKNLIYLVEGPAFTSLDVFTEDKEENLKFDFNKIIPMPQSLNLKEGSIKNRALVFYMTEGLTKDADDELISEVYGKVDSFTDVCIRDIYKQLKEESLSEESKAELMELGEKYVENLKKYGFATWYGWCSHNWGTKWNAFRQVVEDSFIEFETAWEPPIPVFKEFSRKFGLKFDVTFADEDWSGYQGKLHFDNGTMEEYIDEGYEAFEECWGYNPEEEEEEW